MFPMADRRQRRAEATIALVSRLQGSRPCRSQRHEPDLPGVAEPGLEVCLGFGPLRSAGCSLPLLRGDGGDPAQRTTGRTAHPGWPGPDPRRSQRPILGNSLTLAAVIRAWNGNLSGALTALQEATHRHHADGTRRLLGRTLRIAAVVLARLGETRPAAVLPGALAAHFPGPISAIYENERTATGQTQAPARHTLGEAPYNAALRRGAAMDEDEVVGYPVSEFRRIAALLARPGAQVPYAPPGPAYGPPATTAVPSRPALRRPGRGSGRGRVRSPVPGRSTRSRRPARTGCSAVSHSRPMIRDGARPALRKPANGTPLTRHGQPGGDIHLLLDGSSAPRPTAPRSASSAPERPWRNAPCQSRAVRPPPCAPPPPASSSPPPPPPRSSTPTSPGRRDVR